MLINLMMEKLTNDQIAKYFECSVQTILNYKERFKIDNQIHHPTYMGRIGHTVEQEKSPNKIWKHRHCLSCEQSFQSEGPQNRICDSCKRPSHERNCLEKRFEGVG